MRAGLRDKLVVFERRTYAENPDTGAMVGTWGVGFTDWAAIEPRTETNYRFSILYRQAPDGAEITGDNYRLKWGGRIWTITSATPDPRMIDLNIDCDFSDKVESTTLTSTVKEYLDDLPIIQTPE